MMGTDSAATDQEVRDLAEASEAASEPIRPIEPAPGPQLALWVQHCRAPRLHHSYGHIRKDRSGVLRCFVCHPEGADR